jgi:D-xylose transport system permease protein
MSVAAPRTRPLDEEAPPGGVRAAFLGYIARLRAGDVGSLPVIVGMAVIVAVFTSRTSAFFTATNFDNLIVQMAPLVVIAIGVVFVLLLGEIDLSIGYVSGLGGVAAAWLQESGTSHAYSGLIVIPVVILFGAAIGLFQGSFVALIGVPSFVVTLAGLIAFQGVIILWIGTQGTIGIQDEWINDTANYFLPATAGWVLAAIVVSGFALSALGGALSRRRAGLEQTGAATAILRIAFIAVVTFGAVAIANHARGVPFAGVLVVALLALWTFVARRTTFGRHVYAVGGSAEAARRAGINVAFIRIAVFMISSAMAVLGGIAFAARLNSVDLTAGGGPILLNAIAAAVIGGTSLFGGRGRVVSALLGALVIMTIANGLSLLGSSASTQYIITGAILLAAVTLDTVSRRRLEAAGR